MSTQTTPVKTHAHPADAADNVGIVTPKSITFDTPLVLACGDVLERYDLTYETYGALNHDKSNAILICHALSGSHHAAGYHSYDDKKPGWWDNYIGPGKPIDTRRFFVICPNNVGGCDGSTGPASINPKTGKYWGHTFPHMRVRDWVHTQARLADSLDITTWAAVIGASLGGMQAMRWALEYPDRLHHCVVIASAMSLTAQNIAFNETARQAIQADPDFHEGDYLNKQTLPKKGLTVARMVGHITYLSDDGMGEKFGRELRSGSFTQGENKLVEFQIESYLRYQGKKFSRTFDANTYILMTRALDYFDLAREYNNSPAEAFKHAQCQFLVLSFTSDWRFSPERSHEIVSSLIRADKDVTYAQIDSTYGHDAFLVANQERYRALFDTYMKKIEITS